MEIPVNNTSIDTCLWRIQMSIAKKHGYQLGEYFMYPLTWYINSGRASMEFLRRLLKAKPFMIGRILAKGGSDQEVMNRIKGYLKYEPEM